MSNRLINRETFICDDGLFEYGSEIFKKLSKNCDTIFIIDNSNDINSTINEIDTRLQSKKILEMLII